MKFVHIADVHFDIPFRNLQTRGLAEQRRLEVRNAFRKVIDYIQKNDIEYFFICGDLYETQSVRQNTIEYINKLFEEIPNTKIFIVPGNHDPYLKNSYYNTYDFIKNVKIFKSQIEKIELPEVNIYGFGFEDFYWKNMNISENSTVDYDNIIENTKKSKLNGLKIEDKSKINILLTHCDLDGLKNNDEKYNSISKAELKSLGFDYVAMGHIHKPMHDSNIVYPGSLVSLGFDELGEHGMIVRRNKRKDKRSKCAVLLE